MSEHAPRPPSSADRVMQCSGSAEMEARFPDTESEKSREGTAAHWALAEVLHGRAVAVGQITDAGFVLTREMVDAVESTLRWVLWLITSLNEQPVMLIEQRLAPGRRLPAAMWGTPDLVLWFPIARRLVVLDFKFGHGWVEVFENWQLTAYLALVLDHLQIDGLGEQSVRVDLMIDQPRSYHPDGPRRTWEIRRASDLRANFNLLASAVDASLDPLRAKLVTGPACEDCKARHGCPQLIAEGHRAKDRSRAAVPFDLAPEALAIELAEVRRAAKALAALETGLAGQAEALIASGARVPGWALDHPPGRLAWTVTDAEVLALGSVLGVALAKDPEPITPTQAKAKGLDPSLLDAYAARPRGAAKLVQRDDADARRIFS